MKALATISVISIVFLSGCAHYGYQRSYTGYGAGYSSGYGVHSDYAYPSSGYYQQRIVPVNPRAYGPPRHDHEGWRHDWNAAPHGRYGDVREMERRLERQQHAIRQGVRSGDLTRREAERLQQDAHRMDRKLERMQQRAIPSPMQRNQLQHDLNRSQERIMQFRSNGLSDNGRWHGQGGSREGHDRRNHDR
jgi:hypothetical protein